MPTETPWVQAPQIQQPNPLETAGKMQGLLEHQQAYQQQQMLNAAKMAVGQHMQRSIDPKTGEFDKHGFLESVGQDPNAALAFPDIYRTLLENGEIEQRTAGQILNNAKSRNEIVANSLIPLVNMISEGKNVTDADLAGKVGEWQAAGVFKNREQGLQVLTQMAGSNIGSSQNRNDLVRRIVAQTENGRAALDHALQSINTQYKPVTTVGPNGEKVVQPMRNYPGLLPPNGAEQNAVEDGVAPPSSAARQGASPSRSPAAYPVVENAPQQTKSAEEDVTRFQEAKKQILANQSQATLIGQRMEEAEQALKEFKTGPGQDTYTKLATVAGALGMNDLKEALMGGGPGAYAAGQEFVKLMVPQSLELLRNTLGGQGRITNLEVEQFFKANPNLETDPKAIDKIFGFMKRLNRLAREEAHAFEHYEKRAKKLGQYNITQFDNDWAERIANDPVLKAR